MARRRKTPIGEDPAPKLRGEARDALLRAQLEPLEHGEQPLALKVSAAVAAVLAVTNILLWALGVEVKGEEPSAGGVLLFALILMIAAWGIWTHRYWAVLGFQALLAVTIVVAALSLMVASNLLAVLLCSVIMLAGGWLFWKLVRVLARMKAPVPGTFRDEGPSA
ncbi:unannotated protein [freshwater metagenome]|uniref:Unannotated protein n=1 Tax=freshwater metagenome TaxID=449393 RepID=A0A6J7GXA1_9ZZZZ|nr:hypothetical protein [Actinomycetota bacterium]